MNNIEELMRELVKSSVMLKHGLYGRDRTASTTPAGTDGPCIEVHTCCVCNHSAVGENAQVRHTTGCALAKLQKAQADLREAWPELFEKKLAQEAVPECVTHRDKAQIQ
jgi:hypothetical protein